MRALIGVELLRRLPAGPQDIRDTKLPGFVLRVRPSGQHTYFANVGRGQWKRLGTVARVSAPEARALARQELAKKPAQRAQEEQAATAAAADVATSAAADASRITFEAFVTNYYEPWATAHRKTGVEQTARLRSTFGPTLNALRVDEINAFHVERWRSARPNAGISKATVNRDLNTLRGALSRAVVRFLSSTEEHRLLAALRRETRGDAARALARTRGAMSGHMRSGRGWEPTPTI